MLLGKPEPLWSNYFLYSLLSKYTHSLSRGFFSDFESSEESLGRMFKMLSKLHPKVRIIT